MRLASRLALRLARMYGLSSGISRPLGARCCHWVPSPATSPCQCLSSMTYSPLGVRTRASTSLIEPSLATNSTFAQTWYGSASGRYSARLRSPSFSCAYWLGLSSSQRGESRRMYPSLPQPCPVERRSWPAARGAMACHMSASGLSKGMSSPGSFRAQVLRAGNAVRPEMSEYGVVGLPAVRELGRDVEMYRFGGRMRVEQLGYSGSGHRGELPREREALIAVAGLGNDQQPGRVRMVADHRRQWCVGFPGKGQRYEYQRPIVDVDMTYRRDRLGPTGWY